MEIISGKSRCSFETHCGICEDSLPPREDFETLTRPAILRGIMNFRYDTVRILTLATASTATRMPPFPAPWYHPTLGLIIKRKERRHSCRRSVPRIHSLRNLPQLSIQANIESKICDAAPYTIRTLLSRGICEDFLAPRKGFETLTHSATIHVIGEWLH